MSVLSNITTPLAMPIGNGRIDHILSRLSSVFLRMFGVEMRQHVINDGIHLLHKTERIDIDSYSKIVYHSFLLPKERCYIEGVDRMMVNIDLTSVDYRVISV